MPSVPPPDTCLVYLIRHGATENNLADPPLLQGCHVDLGLSLDGRVQAERTARLFREYPIAAVYSSPLKRALETAEIVAAPHRLVVQSSPGITEVDVGRWERRSWREIKQAEPEAYRLFRADPATHGYAGGENLTQVHLRASAAWNSIVSANLGRMIVVIAHNVVNRVLLASLMHVPLAKARTLNQDNCGVNVIRHCQEESEVLSVNSAFHLA